MAQQSYAVPADLVTYSVTQEVYNRFNSANILPMIQAASAFADSFIGSLYQLPLVDWTPVLTMYVAHIAAYNLWRQVGYNPEAPEDRQIRNQFDDAMVFLQAIANEQVHPPFTDSSGLEMAAGDFVISDTSRGYTKRGEDQTIVNELDDWVL